MSQVIGIIGAGKLGITLAQLATKVGYTVYISGSGDPKKIALTTEVLTPGAVALTNEEVALRSEVIILALPLSKFRSLPKNALQGKIVIDAANYWWEIDGPREDTIPLEQSSSEAVQAFLKGARVVKAFNHMGYHDLFDETTPAGARDRKAIAIAGNDPHAIEDVSRIVDQLGFNPHYIGPLSEGRRLEPGTPVFGANVDLAALKQLLEQEK